MSCCPPDSDKFLAATYATVGSTHIVAGTEVEYYATGNKSSQTVIVFLTDVFGWNAGRTRNLADWFGESGYYVVVPKLLGPGLKGGTDGDGYFPEYDPTNADHTALGGPFLKSFNFDAVLKPKITTLTEYMKSIGASRIHLIGFCWGTWVGTHILADADLQASFATMSGPHPSITIEDRIFAGSSEELVSRVRKPVLLLPCENDPDTYRVGGAIHGILSQNLGSDFVVLDMPTVKHGFTVRGDINNPEVYAAVQKALKAILAFIKSHDKTADPLDNLVYEAKKLIDYESIQTVVDSKPVTLADLTCRQVCSLLEFSDLNHLVPYVRSTGLTGKFLIEDFLERSLDDSIAYMKSEYNIDFERRIDARELFDKVKQWANELPPGFCKAIVQIHEKVDHLLADTIKEEVDRRVVLALREAFQTTPCEGTAAAATAETIELPTTESKATALARAAERAQSDKAFEDFLNKKDGRNKPRGGWFAGWR